MATRSLFSQIALVALWTMASHLPAQEPVDSNRALDSMTRRIGQLKIVYAENSEWAAPELLRTPVLRCNDPTRDEMDGAVWLWTAGKRPVAALCVLLYANGKWNYENISLCDDALAVTGRPRWTWKPKAAARTWTTIAEPVPDAPRARQSALRAIARRLEASEVRRGESYSLRLLERPIYEYSDEDQGILDGALFAMSYGTNPEVLAQIEARKVEGKVLWHIAFARMSAAEITVKLGDRALWHTEAMKADDPTGSYFGVNELPSEE